MLDLRSRQILGTVTLVAVAAVTLVVAPYTLLDPMNLPKLPVLAFFAAIALSLIAPSDVRIIVPVSFLLRVSNMCQEYLITLQKSRNPVPTEVGTGFRF